jgi:hypothetical protein
MTSDTPLLCGGVVHLSESFPNVFFILDLQTIYILKLVFEQVWHQARFTKCKPFQNTAECHMEYIINLVD